MQNIYYGERLNYHFCDEAGQWDFPRGKQWKFFSLMRGYYEKGFFWIRLGKRGYGISGTHVSKKRFILFSERMGYVKPVKILGWKIKLLKPFRFAIKSK